MYDDTVRDRFLASASAGTNGCLIWMRARSRSGYGQMTVNYSSVRAHRLAWELTKGPIPDGLFVCHRCDVRACVNIDHLFLGSHHDNMADRSSKGRQATGERLNIRNRARGERGGRSKLTDAIVAACRDRHERGEPIKALGREFGVSDTAMGNAIKRKTWRHVG